MAESPLRRSCTSSPVLSKCASTSSGAPAEVNVSLTKKCRTLFASRSTSHASLAACSVNCQLVSTMSNLTAGQGSFISQRLRTTKKILQGVVFSAKRVWTIKIRQGTDTQIHGSRRPWILGLNEPKKRTRGWQLIRDMP